MYRIYLVRAISSTLFELRIENLSSKLKDQQTERAKTIQKLKDATRYDSTLELLEKYGGGEAKPKSKRKNTEEGASNDSIKKSPGKRQRQETGISRRTNIPPPATANIQRHGLSSQATPQPTGTGPYDTSQDHMLSSPDTGVAVGAEFSPNAFEAARPPRVPGGQYEMAPIGSQNHWYDRIMDLLLGEDETASKNRIVLICKNCRLVNGQAPPGTNNLSDLGIWKCMGCGANNGEVDEGKRIVREVLGEDVRNGGSTNGTKSEEDSSDVAETHSEDGQAEEDTPPKGEEEDMGDEEEKIAAVRKRKGKGKKQ